MKHLLSLARLAARLLLFVLDGTFSAVADRGQDPATEDQQDQSAADHAGDVKHEPGSDRDHSNTEQKSKHCLSTWHVESVRARLAIMR
jgi:hypothetical protein